MEKRQHRRIPFQREVQLATRDGREITLRAIDFSMSGMGLLSDRPAIIGEQVWLRFQVATLGETRELNVPGEIRHVDFKDRGYSLGISFLN